MYFRNRELLNSRELRNMENEIVWVEEDVDDGVWCKVIGDKLVLFESYTGTSRIWFDLIRVDLDDISVYKKNRENKDIAQWLYDELDERLWNEEENDNIASPYITLKLLDDWLKNK